MTPGRALVLALVDQYAAAKSMIDPYTDSGTSHLELQKLLYFATLVAPDPRMVFAQAKYGPYSDAARHMVQQMEGTFLEGYGDGNDRVLELRPISVKPDGRRQLVAYMDGPASVEVTRTLDRVLEIVSGFEGAYGVELLATTHWVATHENARTPHAATAAVRRWSERKGRIFTSDHVASALDHLRSVDAIGA